MHMEYPIWGAEVEKGVEAGKKLPRKIPSLVERFGANHTIDVEFLIIFKKFGICSISFEFFFKFS